MLKRQFLALVAKHDYSWLYNVALLWFAGDVQSLKDIYRWSESPYSYTQYFVAKLLGFGHHHVAFSITLSRSNLDYLVFQKNKMILRFSPYNTDR